MTVQELSAGYLEAAALLRARLKLLRGRLAACGDPDERAKLQRQIAQLTPILSEMNTLAELTAHYYDRGYYRHDAYRI